MFQIDGVKISEEGEVETLKIENYFTFIPFLPRSAIPAKAGILFLHNEVAVSAVGNVTSKNWPPGSSYYRLPVE